MAYTKAKIYNLALSALLLVKEVTNTETDTSNEVRVLNMHWDSALESTLQDLDLDCLSQPVELELIEDFEQVGIWKYAYKYPTNCAFLRRIVSSVEVDNKFTHIPKRVAVLDGERVIYTNEYAAVAEVIANNISLALWPAMACQALAQKLAALSSPLIVGKGAKSLRNEIMQDYLIYKTEAQEADRQENMNFNEDYERSEFVAVRMS